MTSGIRCEVIRLDGAVNLSTGFFQNPIQELLRNVGTSLGNKFPFVNPFITISQKSYANIATVRIITIRSHCRATIMAKLARSL